nr:hypothetical protein TorRG33x02_229840 [Ipomoea batatas]
MPSDSPIIVSTLSTGHRIRKTRSSPAINCALSVKGPPPDSMEYPEVREELLLPRELLKPPDNLEPKVPPPSIGNLDDSLLIPLHQLMHVNPSPCVLPNRLNNATGLPNHAPGLHIVTQDPISGSHHERRVLHFPTTAAAARSQSAVVVGLRRVMVVAMLIIPLFCSG